MEELKRIEIAIDVIQERMKQAKSWENKYPYKYTSEMLWIEHNKNFKKKGKKEKKSV